MLWTLEPAVWVWNATLALVVFYITCCFLIKTFGRRARSLRSQEWAGSTKSWLPQWSWRSITHSRSITIEAYNCHSKHNRPFVIPQWGIEPFLILPQSQMKEVYQRPDADVNITAMLRENLAVKYTGDSDIAADAFHVDIVRQELTRKLSLLTADVFDELSLGFQDEWNVKSDEWRPIILYETAMRIVTRAANRVFSGTELCRNAEFLEYTRQYGQQIFTQAMLINMIPLSFLRPVAAAFLTRKSARHKNIVLKHAAPAIRRRLEAVRAGNKDPPVDCLQWLIEKCVARNDPVELDVTRITRRLLRLNMVAIHTTSITITNAIFELYSSSRAEEYVAGLREEVERVLKAHDGKWSKAAVNELHRIDSTIRESMRCNDFSVFSVARMITAPNGIELSDGLHIPHGTKIAVPNIGIHRDPANYETPDEYDAFRFSRSKESVVITSESALHFGYGRHACPGRFFAAQEMKLMLAYIVMNYDVKIVGSGPRKRDLKALAIPDAEAKILVRRRQTT
ncbi:Cytochrome P450 monooxygenase [Pseudocercospora fuligena]|uniref:Cytochrome P450 monooxygenase n=1 Tax=Pseudocercospora fuligena TaxID=685502 RepID=A0A8H6R9K6_9PEZI|nr:Cytochrome P450 monooxygenase [Pseudocercospora fuligena]